MDFWLGVHMPHWLAKTSVPVMVSHRKLRGRKSFPRAIGPWVLDSGGFTELRMYGRWTVTPREYATAVTRYTEHIGPPTFVAPQDWMTEPFMRERTGLSTEQHQRLTIENWVELRALNVPAIPVLQGWLPHEYEAHVEEYDRAGVDLRAFPVVGIGSVCRRQDTRTGERIVRRLAGYGLRLHGFGVKTTGLRVFGDALASADSMAWSFTARREQIRLDGCTHPRHCANCLTYALRWRDDVLAAAQAPQQHAWGW